MNESAPTTPARTPAVLAMPRWFLPVVFALLAAKLVLVSHQEIEVRSSDDSGYALCASVMYWGAPFQPYSYARQPGYPLFVLLGQVLGIPMRVLIELVWFGVSAAIAVALRRAGLSVWAATTAFVLALFNPISLWLFNRLLPDGLYGACMLLLSAGLIGALTTPTRGSAWRWGMLAALGAAIGANTRQETPLTYGLIGIAGVLALAGAWRAWNAGAQARLWARLGAAVALPVVVTLGLTHAFCLANQRAVGLYVTYDLVAPGLKSLYRELLSIPPKDARIDVPVPRDVRDVAYAHSPTFKSLEVFLDGEQDPQNPYKAACKQFTGVDNEYGAWLVWGLRRAAWRSTNFKWSSAAEMDALFAKAADELVAARRSGAIAHRRVLHEYLPPEYGQLAHALPSSLRKCWGHVSTISTRSTPPDQVDPWFVERINAAAVRRMPTAQVQDFKPEAPPSIWHQAGVVGAMNTVKQRIGEAGEFLTVVGAIAGGLVAVLAVPLWLRSGAGAGARGALIAGVILVAAVASRFLLFGVLDACGIFSQQRYMFAAGALMLILIPVAAEGLWQAVRARAK